MSQRHLSDDQLIDRLYGMDRTGDAHLDVCPHCASRWEMFQERRVQMAGEVPESAVLWAEQRRQILEQMETGAGASWSWRRAWAPALLTAAILLVSGVWFYRPATAPPPAPVPVAVDTTDPGWYEDTYSVMQPDEPRAASAIRALFEQQEEKVTE